MADPAMKPSSEVRSFRDLLVWQLAMDLAVRVRRLAATLPPEERFELGREIRRSSTSIPSNIAEGFCRHSRRAYRAHVTIALGSGGELATQLELVRRLGYLPESECAPVLADTETVSRLAQGLWRSLAPAGDGEPGHNVKARPR
ncbi:MAG: four helix bundle protein [Vicinamibacterales bacterium]